MPNSLVEYPPPSLTCSSPLSLISPINQMWTKRINDSIDLMRQLFFLADNDIDLSARTWYYALSLELILEAGVVLESYDNIYTYYKTFVGEKETRPGLRSLIV